jgi:hypothetical protein
MTDLQDYLALKPQFEEFVTRYTGRDMAYHERYETTDLGFGWECWKAATAASESRANAYMETILVKNELLNELEARALAAEKPEASKVLTD